MKSSFPWFVTLAGICLGTWLLGLVLGQGVVAKPPATAPIVLHYKEGPTFLGPHEHNVTAIAFSPDGKTVATGSGDGYLRFWDVTTGRLRSMHADDATRGIDGLAFSPDGRQVAMVGGLFGREAMLWDAASGRIAREFEDPANAVYSTASLRDTAPFIYKGKPIVFRVLSAVAFSPDGRNLATAPDGVVLRDAQSGSVVATLDQPAKGVKAIAFSPDGKTLATAADDKKVRLWSVPGGALEATLDGPTQPLVSVAISPDGKRIVAASSGNRSLFDRTPVGYLWSWERSGGTARKMEIGKVSVRQVAFVAPTTVVLSAGREILSLDLQGDNSTRPRKIWSHSKEVLAVAVSPDRRLVASGGADRTVDIIDVSTGKLIQRLPGLMDCISSVAASVDGKRFATATIDIRFAKHDPESETTFAARYKKYFSEAANTDRLQPGEVRIWSTDDGRMQSMLPLPPSQVSAIDFIPRTSQLAVAGWLPEKGGMLSLWDTSDGKHLRDFAAGSAEVLSIAVSPDGRTLASGDADGNVNLWDVQSGAKTRSHKHDHAIEAVAFSADGKRLAAGDAHRTVRVFDAASGSIVRTLNSRSSIESLDFSPDGALLAAGTRDAGLELWDLRAGTASRTLKAHDESFGGFVAFSPDGRFVVCGGHGKDIAVFDAAKGTLHCELRGHFHAATAVAFLPDGRLVSGGEERTVRLWAPTLVSCWPPGSSCPPTRSRIGPTSGSVSSRRDSSWVRLAWIGSSDGNRAGTSSRAQEGAGPAARGKLVSRPSLSPIRAKVSCRNVSTATSINRFAIVVACSPARSR